MKVGDSVKLVRVPPELPEGDEWLLTKENFEKCVGHLLSVAGFNDLGWAELNIESVTGSVGETIWVEPDYLELQ